MPVRKRGHGNHTNFSAKHSRQRASGSGRTCSLYTLGLFVVPPSLWQSESPVGSAVLDVSSTKIDLLRIRIIHARMILIDHFGALVLAMPGAPSSEFRNASRKRGVRSPAA